MNAGSSGLKWPVLLDRLPVEARIPGVAVVFALGELVLAQTSSVYIEGEVAVVIMF